jgi:hypothetical protein
MTISSATVIFPLWLFFTFEESDYSAETKKVDSTARRQ